MAAQQLSIIDDREAPLIQQCVPARKAGVALLCARSIFLTRVSRNLRHADFRCQAAVIVVRADWHHDAETWRATTPN